MLVVYYVINIHSIYVKDSKAFCIIRTVQETVEDLTEQGVWETEEVASHCKNHIYWMAGSSTSVPERAAKWTSILNHV